MVVSKGQDLHYLFSSIGEVLFNLIVSKLKDLEPIWECGLGCLGFCKVINNFLVWISLFNVIVIKVNYGIAIRENFSFHAIVEDNFFLTIFIDSLDFSIMSYNLFNNFLV